jgi:hypothetical protein
MGEFVKVDFRNGTQVTKMRCGCEFNEEGALLHRCAGHPDRQPLQKAKRAPVVPIKPEPREGLFSRLVRKVWR